jgi:hypothetical protein
MSANDKNHRSNPARDDQDVDYGDDMNLDLELERVIRHLDEATAEAAPPTLVSEPPPRTRPAEGRSHQPLLGRDPVPVRDPRLAPKDTIILTTPPPRRDGHDVVDLVDEIDEPPPEAVYEPAQASPPRTVGEMTPAEFGELITKAVERAMRRFYSR